MNRLFGTDGVRGIAGSELTPILAFQLGRAGAHVLAQTNKKPTILVGKDTRLSCDMLENALISGILSAGANSEQLGIMPTPAVAFLTRNSCAAAGVVISASHNPAKYNGIKFFSSDGYKLPNAVEDSIQNLIEADNIPQLTGPNIGRNFMNTLAAEKYATYVAKTICTPLFGIRVAMDCANGATSLIAPKVLESLGAKVTVISNIPNGLNINDGCGSTNLENISAFVKNGNFDIGISFDGDGDRVLLTDENGKNIDGDSIMAVASIFLKQENRLKNDTLVATVMSNLGLENACRENGITLLRTAVGDRYVLEEMQKNDLVLGGEQSGHIIFAEHATTGDGLISALQFLEIMQKRGKTASALASCMTHFPQILRNIRVDGSEKYSITKQEDISREIQRIKNALGARGRILIRPSGTEPRIRIMLEGENLSILKKEADTLEMLIYSHLKS